MQRVELVLALAITVLWIYSIVNCVMTPESGVRGLPKFAWVILIVLLPLLGSILWLAVGRTSGPPRLPRPRAAGPAAAAAGPPTYSALTSDERIRRMEEDLERLERESGAEPDDGTEGPGDQGPRPRRG